MPLSQRRGEYFRSRYGPWAVVTGASSGIGRALATELAGVGLNLVLVARSREALDRLAAELATAHAVDCRVITLDLADTSAMELLIEATRELDVGLLIASAGFGTSGTFLEGSIATEMEMLHVNCRALMSQVWSFGQRMKKRGRGGIILLGSIVGFQGMPYAAHYAATKAYVQTLGEALAVELAPLGIDVLAAAPGPTTSGFAARAGMTMGAALQPAAIAPSILNALGRRSTTLPGFLSKVLVYSMVPLPRWARVRIMGRVMQGMTRPQNQAVSP